MAHITTEPPANEVTTVEDKTEQATDYIVTTVEDKTKQATDYIMTTEAEKQDISTSTEHFTTVAEALPVKQTVNSDQSVKHTTLAVDQSEESTTSGISTMASEQAETQTTVKYDSTVGQLDMKLTTADHISTNEPSDKWMTTTTDSNIDQSDKESSTLFVLTTDNIIMSTVGQTDIHTTTSPEQWPTTLETDITTLQHDADQTTVSLVPEGAHAVSDAGRIDIQGMHILKLLMATNLLYP